jgi:hypothetical protein
MDLLDQGTRTESPGGMKVRPAPSNTGDGVTHVLIRKCHLCPDTEQGGVVALGGPALPGPAARRPNGLPSIHDADPLSNNRPISVAFLMRVVETGELDSFFESRVVDHLGASPMEKTRHLGTCS